MTYRAIVLTLLFLLTSVSFQAQRKDADEPFGMVSDRLPRAEEPADLPRQIATEGDNLISAATYPMTVLGGWPLENMSAGTTQLIGPSTDNDNSALAPIGFTFRMNNAYYTTFGANGNGFITLGRVPSGALNTNNLSDGGINNPKAAPFWDDLCVGSNGKVHYKTIGSPGMRKLIVEWQNMQITRNGACAGPGTGTFQLWLVEGLGVIQFVYGNGMTASAAADGGYSVGITSTTGPMQTFATISTAANTVGYSVPRNDQTDAIPSGKSYVFAPHVPSTPSGGSVTSITQFSLILNWTDNANNEVFYEIYRSTDNVNFTLQGSLPPNSIQYIDDELEPGTQYFYHVQATAEGASSFPLSLQATALPAGEIASTASGGMWSVPSTWAGGVVPQTGDNVTIVDGAQVTIDTAAVAMNVSVGSTGSRSESGADKPGLVNIVPATLTFEETSAHTLTVRNNVLIKSNGIFATFGLGNVTTHVLNIGGNLTNNGALDFSTNNNMAGATINFTGSSNNFFNGTGPITDVRGISISKSPTSILELAPANFTVQGSTTDTPGSGFLTLGAGIFKIGGTFTGTHRTFPNASYLIFRDSGLWLNNPNYTVAAQTGTATVLGGLLRVTNGTFNVGTDAGNALVTQTLPFDIFGTVMIEGGAVNVSGRFGASGGSSDIVYSQSGGTLTTCTSPGGSFNQLACFDLGTSDLSSVTMTGGEIVVQNANVAAQGLDYRHQAGFTGTATVTGGTVRFGNASTTGGANSFRGVGVLPNMVIDNTTAGHVFTFQNPINFQNLTRNVLINSGTSFVTGTSPYLMNGSSFVNNGTLLSAALDTSFVWFDPAGNPTYSGTGVISNIVNRFVMQGQSVTFNQTSNVRVRNMIVFTGNVISANKLTIGNNDTTASVIQFGNDTTPTPAGTLDLSPVFNLGSGGLTLRYLRTGAIRSTGPEVPSSRTLAGLTYDNDDPATDELNIAGGDLLVNGSLNLTNGEIKTGANQLVHNGAVVRTTGFVNGTFTRTIIVSGSYLFPVGVNGYSPVGLMVDGVTNPPAIVSVKPVDAVLPGMDPATSASRYWEVVKSGTFTGRLLFTYTDADINGDENAYGAWVARGGLNPIRESQTNDPGNNRVLSSPSLLNMTGNWAAGCCVVPRTLAGTIRTADGAPVRNAIVRLSGGGLPQPVEFQTGNFGQYFFSGVPSGTLFTLSVSAKRFRFTPASRDVVLAGDDLTQDFAASPQFEGKLLP